MLGACRSRRGDDKDRSGCSSARVRVVVVVVVERVTVGRRCDR